MESDLAQTKARLKEALERVELIHQAVLVDLSRVAKVSFLCFLSTIPWSSTGCVSVLTSRFAGVRGDVDPQVTFPLRGAQLDGAGSHDVMVGQQA